MKERLVIQAEFINGYDGITQFGLGCWQGTKTSGPPESGSPASRCAPLPTETAFTTLKTTTTAVPVIISPPEIGSVVEARDNGGNELMQTPWQAISFALSLPTATWSTLTMCGIPAMPASPLIESRIRLYPRKVRRREMRREMRRETRREKDEKKKDEKRDEKRGEQSEENKRGARPTRSFVLDMCT